MLDSDIVDLWSFWQTLPVSNEPSKDHKLFLPFNRVISEYGSAYSCVREFVGDAKNSSTYLVEPLRRGKCHTRNSFLALNSKKWMRRVLNPSGKGKYQAFIQRPQMDFREIAEYLRSGPDP